MPTIEQNLERIADALEKIAAQGGGVAAQVQQVVAEKPAETKAEKPAETKAADKPKAEADKPAEKPAEKPKSSKTIEDVRTALKNYREIEGTPAMLEVLKKHGAANINELAKEHYEAVIAAVS